MSSLKPLADRVLVKPDEAEQKTASGLYIASNAQEPSLVRISDSSLNAPAA